MIKERQERQPRGRRSVCSPILVIVLGLSLALFQTPVEAQKRHRGSPNALALDVVFLKDKQTLYGLVHQIDKDNLSLVVERQWLRDHHPDIYDQYAGVEKKQDQLARDEMQQRIERWLLESDDNVDLKIFLEDELKRIREKPDLEGPASYRFMFVSIPQLKIRRLVQQSPWQTQVAVVSWKKELADITVRTADELRLELERKQIPWKTLHPDFSGEITAQAQSDREWSYRQAIVEHALTTPLEFQGVEGALVRRGGSPDLKTMLQMALGSTPRGQSIQQLGEELGLPEFTRNKAGVARKQSTKERWQDQIAIAKREGVRGFSVIQMDASQVGSLVKVNVFFIAKDELGEWQLLKRFTGSARADRQNKDDLLALKMDPQVERIISLSKGLGLTSETQLDLALKHGLATQAAMQQAMNEFAFYLKANSKDLNGPRLDNADD